MTVVVAAPPAFRNFRGWADPGLPDGYWYYENSSLGDASGGLNIIQVTFQAVDEPAPSLIWSLEQFNLHSTAGVETAKITITNMDRVPQLGAGINLVRAYAIELVSTPIGAALALRDMVVPIFLGQAIDNNQISDLQFDAANSNGQVILLHAQGYFWGPGAINAEGGPRRPLGSIFGQ